MLGVVWISWVHGRTLLGYRIKHFLLSDHQGRFWNGTEFWQSGISKQARDINEAGAVEIDSTRKKIEKDGWTANPCGRIFLSAGFTFKEGSWICFRFPYNYHHCPDRFWGPQFLLNFQKPKNMSNARLPFNHDRTHLAPNLVHASATSLKCIPTVDIRTTQIPSFPVNISLKSTKPNFLALWSCLRHTSPSALQMTTNSTLSLPATASISIPYPSPTATCTPSHTYSLRLHIGKTVEAPPTLVHNRNTCNLQTTIIPMALMRILELTPGGWVLATVLNADHTPRLIAEEIIHFPHVVSVAQCFKPMTRISPLSYLLLYIGSSKGMVAMMMVVTRQVFAVEVARWMC